MSIQNHIVQLNRSIENLKNYATSGELQPFEAYALIKESGVDEKLNSCISEVRGVAVEELQRNYLEGNEKTYKGNGYKFTVRSGATRYYFTDVPEVKEKKKIMETSNEYREWKSTEQKYKTAFLMKQKNQIMVEEETGEVIDPSTVKVVHSPDTLSVKKIEAEMA